MPPLSQGINNPFRQVSYYLGAAELKQLPEDSGFEVAFAGRSNSGKSSALNTLCEQKQLARTSKTPGRTQLINLFSVDKNRRLVDLPGYGYAQVSLEVKQRWQATLAQYLQERLCLKGLILLSDIRHPLKETDQQMIQWAAAAHLPTHILLSKADKLKQGAQKKALMLQQQIIKELHAEASVQTFSSLKKQGIEHLIQVLKGWYEMDNEKATDSEIE